MSAQSNSYTRSFGAGDVYALVPGLTPAKFGTLQDIEIEVSAAAVELHGQNQFPEAVARGKGKITGKAKMGRFDIFLFNSLYYGGSVTQGAYEKLVKNEAHAAGASLPTFTATLSSGGIQDLGLFYSSGSTPGVQLSYSTAAAPAIGNYNYSTASGVYTVSTAEASSTPFVANYNYQATSGNNLLVTNQLMGVNPQFELHLYEGIGQGSARTNFDMKLFACMATKTTFPNKNTEWMVQDFEFEAFADSNDQVFQLGLGN